MAATLRSSVGFLYYILRELYRIKCLLIMVAHFAKKTTMINPLGQVFNVNITHSERIIA